MKILYVTSNVPWPPTVGSRMRSYNILQLLGFDNEVTVALLHSGAKEIAIFEGDPQRWPRREVVPAPKKPSFLRRWRDVVFERYRPMFKATAYGSYRAGLRAVVDREKPDLVWFFRLETVWLAGCDRYDCPVICDVDDFEAKAHRRAITLLPLVKRLLALLDYPLAVRAQRAAARTCGVLLVSNPDDVDEVAAMTGRPALVAPNGYDYSTTPVYGGQGESRLVFFGSLSYRPNTDGLLWFTQEIWPLIREAIPDAQLDVAGVVSPALESLSSEPGVRLYGFVESIRSFVEGAALLIVPLRMGGGTRIKILEAWALGLPVVSTTIGCEGLNAEDGETLLVADNPRSFAEACITLVRSPEVGARMAARAFEFAKSHFDWPALAPQFMDALDVATRPRTPAGAK